MCKSRLAWNFPTRQMYTPLIQKVFGTGSLVKWTNIVVLNNSDAKTTDVFPAVTTAMVGMIVETILMNDIAQLAETYVLQMNCSVAEFKTTTTTSASPNHGDVMDLADCYYREDETNCKENRDILQPTYLRKKKSLAVNWTYELRNDENPTRKWGSEVARIAVALYLSNNTLFVSNSTLRDEIAYELSLDLLSRLALKKITDVSSTELAAYINAFLVTCIDPKKFYVLDLVSELRKRVDAQNYTNPSVLLALCNAGERIMDRDIQKLLSLFDNVHREFWTDTQALAILALTCASKQPYEAYDLEEIRELTMELKKRQYRNGTVENLKTTALVMQALLAAESEADEENFDEEKALKQILHSQMADGSFGSIVNTYYVLPALGRKSLVNISSSHCTPAVVDENDAIKDLMNQVGEKWRIHISLWIGNDRTVERTLALKVPANSSLYRVMEIAATVDDKYKFEYSMRNGKPFIYSISGFQDDPENEMFWFLFTSKDEMKEELHPTTKSPADIVPRDKQHLVFWYKCGSWNQ
ncbi:uncharacterized protein CEXT_337171 [Caerostris extrusa]|uniref:Uncharacterized protein n=1 Tax=Caerostris extrusa TaxID=172846 RepID=A0AAV4V742_CAEEX|nr:uncharacterized protein CEXT_337171 [Caerostris extrusa]